MKKNRFRIFCGFLGATALGLSVFIFSGCGEESSAQCAPESQSSGKIKRASNEPWSYEDAVAILRNSTLNGRDSIDEIMAVLKKTSYGSGRINDDQAFAEKLMKNDRRASAIHQEIQRLTKELDGAEELWEADFEARKKEFEKEQLKFQSDRVSRKSVRGLRDKLRAMKKGREAQIEETKSKITAKISELKSEFERLTDIYGNGPWIPLELFQRSENRALLSALLEETLPYVAKSEWKGWVSDRYSDLGLDEKGNRLIKFQVNFMFHLYMNKTLYQKYVESLSEEVKETLKKNGATLDSSSGWYKLKTWANKNGKGFDANFLNPDDFVSASQECATDLYAILRVAPDGTVSLKESYSNFSDVFEKRK